MLTLSFFLLTLAFRSIAIPLTAIAVNLLSVGAAYGILVLVFQEGVGADLLGFTQVERIELLRSGCIPGGPCGAPGARLA